MFQVQYDVISEFEQDRNNSFQDEESNINIFTQHQLGLFKKPSYFVESEEFNLKNNCECSTAEQTESSEHSDNSFEDIPSPKFPSKQLPPPINADQHLFNLEMKYYPSIPQENFLLNFINQEDLQRIKIGLDYKILDDPQTLKFENWVQQLCNTKANQKEMQRKLKVKKYLEKKHNRTSFEKKVHYQIRQKVAEERLRIKGRFVTWKQVQQKQKSQQLYNINIQCRLLKCQRNQIPRESGLIVITLKQRSCQMKSMANEKEQQILIFHFICLYVFHYRIIVFK